MNSAHPQSEIEIRKSKIALVTGGGTGIGRGVALALARRGIALALVGRRQAPLEAVAAEARLLGVRALPIPADLTRRDELEAALARAQQELGPIHILVNNAGVLAGGALLDQTPETIERAVGLNLGAPLLLTRLALPDLIATGGALVLVGSMASLVPLPFASLYAGTKTGLHGFGTALRYELEPLGVHTLLVYPPATDTRMVRGMAQAAGAADDSPFARTLDPEAVGERIAVALEQRRAELTWRGPDLLAAHVYRWWPGLVRFALRRERDRFARMMAAAPRSDQ